MGYGWQSRIFYIFLLSIIIIKYPNIMITRSSGQPFTWSKVTRADISFVLWYHWFQCWIHRSNLYKNFMIKIFNISKLNIHTQIYIYFHYHYLWYLSSVTLKALDDAHWIEEKLHTNFVSVHEVNQYLESRFTRILSKITIWLFPKWLLSS